MPAEFDTCLCISPERLFPAESIINHLRSNASLHLVLRAYSDWLEYNTHLHEIWKKSFPKLLNKYFISLDHL